MHRDPTANHAISQLVREERNRVPVVREARRKHGLWYASQEEVQRFVEMIEAMRGAQ